MDLSLERALKCLVAGQEEEALETLISVWGGCRDVVVSALISTLSDRITTSGLVEITGRTVAERHASWLAIAATQRAAELGGLLPTLATGRGAQQALERLVALNERPPDPRIAAALLSLVDAPPFRVQSETLRTFWRAAFRALFDHADPEAVEILSQMVGGNVERLGGRAVGEFFDRQLAAILPKIEARLTEVSRPLTTHEEEACRALAAELEGREASDGKARRARTEARAAEDFVEAVAEKTEEDEPRLVFADWLAERGDP